jgi:hypothetical protein
MREGFSSQRGMTAIGWAIVLGLIAFFALLTLRLAPVYLENYEVKSVLASLKNEPEIGQKSVREIRNLVDNRLYINGVQTVQAREFQIVQKGGTTTVSIDYEVRRPFIGNVELLVHFIDVAEFASR